MPKDHVENDEELYRRIPNDPLIFSIVEGRPRFSTTAFNDRNKKPSVDRAKLRSSPSDTKTTITDGVISLLTAEVRAISVENTNVNSTEPKNYSVDVIPRPIPVDNPEGLPENKAHAQVETDPELASPSRFKKLKEALALLASQRDWLIKPS